MGPDARSALFGINGIRIGRAKPGVEHQFAGIAVRLEAMITIARYGGTTRPRPQRAIAMAVRFVVTIPAA